MLTVICLTNDKLGYLIGLIESLILKADNPSKLQLLIGDTGISEKTLEKIKPLIDKLDSQSKIIEMKYHFSKNNNKLVSYAVYDDLLFCNNDILIETNSFDSMISDLLIKYDNSIVGAKLLYPNRTIQHGGVSMIYAGPNKYLAYHPGRFQNGQHNYWNRGGEIDAVTGAFVAIKRNTFEKAGGFDERYDEECQDVDLCLKVRERGGVVLYAPQLVAYHLENGTRTLNAACERDRTTFIKKWKYTIDKKLKDFYKVPNATTRRILFKRAGARGDVLATIVILNEFKKLNSNFEIHLMTKFYEIGSSFACIDRTLSWDEPYLESEYSLVVDCVYENETWRNSTVGWFQALGENLSLEIDPKEVKNLYKKAGCELVESDGYKINLSELGRYKVISPGAGWSERRPSKSFWKGLSERIRRQGFKVVLLASSQDDIDGISADLTLIDCDLVELVQVAKQSSECHVLDSYMLHVCMVAGSDNITAYTCKTTIKSVFGEEIIHEVRSKQKTDIHNCVKYGCRFKYGHGTEYSCASQFDNLGID